MRDQLTHFGFDMIAIADHRELRDTIAATPPAAVIMDVAFPGDFDAGVATIGALKDEDAVPCPMVFLSVRRDIPARLSAVRAGCDGYLVKPVDLIELVDLMNRLTKRMSEDAYRVVVIDDDPEVAEFNASLLARARMETAVVTDPMKVMAPIRELRPDVTLMDIQMPGCDGFELAKVIRHDKAFIQTPIVFLTGSDVKDAWRRAMKSGADELLHKDIDPAELLFSVLARARRARDLSSVITRLGESEGRFRAVTESAREAIITADEKGRIAMEPYLVSNLVNWRRHTTTLSPPFTQTTAKGFHPRSRPVSRKASSTISNTGSCGPTAPSTGCTNGVTWSGMTMERP